MRVPLFQATGPWRTIFRNRGQLSLMAVYPEGFYDLILIS